MQSQLALCGKPVRGGGTCKLEYGHGGYHSTVAFECDGCGHVRRGVPAAYAQDGEYPKGLQYCFFCTKTYAFLRYP